MRIEHFKHENVREDGATLVNGEPYGSVHTTPGIRMSPDEGGCGIDNCNCSKGHWLMIGFGRDAETQTVSGVTVWFDNYDEMQSFLKVRHIRAEA